MAAIILDSVSLSSENVTLTDISLTIKTGSLFALLGLPGSGKALLLKALMNIVNHDAGRIVIMGGNRQDHYPNMHFIPRELSFYANMTVRESLRYYGLREGKIAVERLDGVIDSVLAMLGLAEVNDVYHMDLSIEHQWCLQIAILAVVKADIILWDEPLHNLTVLQRKLLFAHLRQLLPHATIVFTTTSLADALTADEGALLHDGRVLWQGTFEDVVAHETTATYDLLLTGNADHILPIIESLSWVETIERMTTGSRSRCLITVKNETNAERDLLRAVLADNNLKISHFQLLRPRLKDVLDQIRALENHRTS